MLTDLRALVNSDPYHDPETIFSVVEIELYDAFLLDMDLIANSKVHLLLTALPSAW